MLIYAIVIFTIVAATGLILASRVLAGQLASWSLSVLHALLGLAGLFVLAKIALEGAGAGRVVASLTLFVIGALVGLMLASFHMRRKIPHKGIVVLHLGLGVVGFLILLTVFLGI